VKSKWRLCLLVLLASSVAAQEEQSRTLELDDGERIAYTLRRHPLDAHTALPAKSLAPTSALDTAKLLNLHLTTGDIEEAALLSNAPRRRFEEFQKFQQAHGNEEFKRVFAEYFDPKNRLLAEIVIGRHSMLVWDQTMTSAIAGQFFVNVEGRYLIDDVPNEARSRLRKVLEAYRAGKISR
jgi:hypothetical protein